MFRCVLPILGSEGRTVINITPHYYVFWKPFPTQVLQLFVFLVNFTKTEEKKSQLTFSQWFFLWICRRRANVRYCYGPLVAFALPRDHQGEILVRNWWMICTSWQQLGAHPKVKTKTEEKVGNMSWRCIKLYLYMGVSKNRGTPKWMVKIMENPIKMEDLGVPLFSETSIW